LHPDLCVALGAGVLASRLGGHDVQRVLVDVSPYSFGPSYLGEYQGRIYPHCYHPVIRRNTPLPVTRTDVYETAADFQTCVDLSIYQGDEPDALQNVPVGKFTIEGLAPVQGANEVLCRMRLDLDGILHVTAIEKKTGLSKHIAITGATRPRDAAEMTRGREQLDKLFASRVHEDAPSVVPEAAVESDEGAEFPAAIDIPAAPAAGSGNTPPIPAVAGAALDPAALVARCRARISSMHADDQEEALGLIEEVETALAASNGDALTTASAELSEFLFFVEGR
jgi:hypothetical protein